MKALIFLLTVVYLAFLAFEARCAGLDRKNIRHIIHVNGIRGKSSVSRLIDAGLRAGGFRVFCKTTGTLPMVIDADGVEHPIIRRGKSNIKEQLKILHMAAKEKADILVIECMAVDPALQSVCQHQMLKADIGVITNVRLDHTDEMGATLDEICDSLCNTVPKNGIVFTADAGYFSSIERKAAGLLSRAVLAEGKGSPAQDIDFPENVALALAVCHHLGVERMTALRGMYGYKRDPYALSLFTLHGGALFINGLSINDPDSSFGVWEMLKSRYSLADRRLILLINNRPDRGYRTGHMIMLAERLSPEEVWLLGDFQGIVSRKLRRLADAPTVRRFRTAGGIPFEGAGDGTVIFAVGNIANQGRRLMERVREEGTPYVS